MTPTNVTLLTEIFRFSAVVSQRANYKIDEFVETCIKIALDFLIPQ